MSINEQNQGVARPNKGVEKVIKKIVELLKIVEKLPKPINTDILNVFREKDNEIDDLSLIAQAIIKHENDWYRSSEKWIIDGKTKLILKDPTGAMGLVNKPVKSIGMFSIPYLKRLITIAEEIEKYQSDYLPLTIFKLDDGCLGAGINLFDKFSIILAPQMDDEEENEEDFDDDWSEEEEF